MHKSRLTNTISAKNILVTGKGQGITEYALILGLVVILGITILADNSLKVGITGVFIDIANQLAKLALF